MATDGCDGCDGCGGGDGEASAALAWFKWPFRYCSCIHLVAGHHEMSHNVEGGYMY